MAGEESGMKETHPEGGAPAGVLREFARTWRDATFRPGEFFARAPAGTGRAIAYAVVCWMAFAAANALQQPLLAGVVEGLPQRTRVLGEALRTSPFLVTQSLPVGPLLWVAGIFLAGAVFHAMLILLDGAHGGFLTTVRTLCYASGPLVIWLLPVVGPIVGPLALPLWWLALATLGLARAHGIETWRGALAVLLPAMVVGALALSWLLRLAAALLRAVPAFGG